LSGVKLSFLAVACAACAAAPVRRPPVAPPIAVVAGASVIVDGDATVLVVGERRLRVAPAAKAEARLDQVTVDRRTAWRIDLSVSEAGRFARREILVEDAGGELRKTFDRLVESASDALLLYATAEARDVDGDGRDELVVEERGTGGRHRTLVYRRGPDGQFRTDGVSLWKVVP
jgi:hypothetical protein